MSKLGQLWRLLRTYSQFHENEKLIAWLQQQRWVVWLTPQRRRWLLTLAAVIAGVGSTVNRYKNFRYDSAEKYWFVPIVTFLVLSAALYVLYFAAAHYQKLPALIKRRPQLSLHLIFWGFLAGLWFLPQGEGWWRSCLLLIAISCPILIWRCGYVLISGRRGNAQNTSFGAHWIYLWPIWGGTNTPHRQGLGLSIAVRSQDR